MALSMVRAGALFLLGIYAGGLFFFVLAPGVASLPGEAYCLYWQACNRDYGARAPIVVLSYGPPGSDMPAFATRGVDRVATRGACAPAGGAVDHRHDHPDGAVESHRRWLGLARTPAGLGKHPRTVAELAVRSDNSYRDGLRCLARKLGSLGNPRRTHRDRIRHDHSGRPTSRNRGRSPGQLTGSIPRQQCWYCSMLSASTEASSVVVPMPRLPDCS